MNLEEQNYPRLPWLPEYLLRNRTDVARVIFYGAFSAAVPLVVLNVIANWIGVMKIEPEGLFVRWPVGSVDGILAMGIIDVLLLSPLVETGLCLLPIRLLRKIRMPESLVPVLVGLGWGLVHWHTSGHFIGVLHAWPFYLFASILMLFERGSLDRAWLIASGVHALSNVCTLAVSFVLATA